MKQVNGIEMANSKELYGVDYSGKIEIKPASNGEGFELWINGEESDFAETKREANALAKDYIVDSQLIVSGYGTHSGRKFWQLPQKIQTEVIAMARRQ